MKLGFAMMAIGVGMAATACSSPTAPTDVPTNSDAAMLDVNRAGNDTIIPETTPPQDVARVDHTDTVVPDATISDVSARPDAVVPNDSVSNEASVVTDTSTFADESAPDDVMEVTDDGIDRSCPGPLFTASCTVISTPACVTCESSDVCINTVDNCITQPDGTPFTQEQQDICFNVIRCFNSSGCFDGPSTTLGSCFCGSFPTGPCGSAPLTGPGAPDGPCHEQILAGMVGFTNNQQILGNLTSQTHPAGAAMQRMNCAKVGNDGICADTCGFGAGSGSFP